MMRVARKGESWRRLDRGSARLVAQWRGDAVDDSPKRRVARRRHTRRVRARSGPLDRYTILARGRGRRAAGPDGSGKEEEAKKDAALRFAVLRGPTKCSSPTAASSPYSMPPGHRY